MGILQRVVSSIINKKIKYFLLFIIFFLLGNFLVIGIGINDASKMAVIKSREMLNPIIIFEQVDDSPEDYGIYYDDAIVEIINEIVLDERILVYNKITGMNMVVQNADAVDINVVDENIKQIENGVYISGNNTDSMFEIDDGSYEVVEGRFYTLDEIKNSEKVVLITNQFADLNNLKIGDKLQFKGDNHDELLKYFEDDFDPIIEYEIIGIFNNNQIIENENEDYINYNVMLAPAKSFLDFEDNYRNADLQLASFIYGWKDESSMVKSEDMYDAELPIIKLKDPDDLASFVEDYEEMILPYYTMNYNNELFENYGKPLDIITYFSNLILIAIVVNMILMFTAIIFLYVKMRDNEIGILLSIGIKKIEIMTQIFLEILIIGFLGISLALFSGSLLGNKFGNEIINISVVQNNINEYEDGDMFYNHDKDYFSELTQADVFNNFDFNITKSLAISIYFMIFIIVLISCVIPSILIMIQDPNKILNRKE